VAYEHDEDVSSHLALLCHVCLLLADHEEHLVAAAAQQLLINCLYSLSAHHLELMQEERQPVECLQVRVGVCVRVSAALCSMADGAAWCRG
jgi:hypothetical protein